ncbi:hypothetical protein CBF45_02765 [Bordetella sp. J329]|jgi:membrane protease YdiL (CAAX protease family)|uniref:CPBP family glutamic-type intramembrane protease n=1 Tax=Kerstersia gyiorum TaxID=206506 RepID=UPI000FDBCE8F|nr:CPBP family glutamic-type intramembrane protease [Kerstersia gyiorum]AZV92779.1 hypothetical protein CBF45_02765 [Bordetella sp. J329]MCH4272691.1 CPBP family glutamic-type intramembrane protease [Kerstersia gyiorum]MCI1230058.1 CPBP family glutamic-type intramembrane protease [Kerstersia gyiorum]
MSSGRPAGLGNDLREFLAFVRRPTLARRRPTAMGLPVDNGRADWLRLPRLHRMLLWAGLLWLISLLVFAPMIVGVTERGGATHKLVLHQWLWLHAIVWAPVTEELVFRYWLRRPWLGAALLPPLIVVLVNGPTWWTGSLLTLVLAVLWWPRTRHHVPRRAWRPLRWYRRFFPWIFHLSALGFASMHLINFNLGHLSWWLMPVLVLPQWLAGLALGWIRVRAGIGAAIVLHGIYNAGPVMVLMLVMWLLPSGSMSGM